MGKLEVQLDRRNAISKSKIRRKWNSLQTLAQELAY